MIDSNIVADLRARTGAGMMDCKRALVAAGGDVEKAIQELKKTGAIKASKKSAERETAEGIVESYIHSNGKVGAMVELQCETDFVARNKEFKELAHEITMQVAATNPEYVSVEDIPGEIIEKMKLGFMAELAKEKKSDDVKAKIIEGKLAKWYEETVLVKQPWVKDDSKKIEDLIQEKIANMGEKIVVARFSRLDVSASGNKVC